MADQMDIICAKGHLAGQRLCVLLCFFLGPRSVRKALDMGCKGHGVGTIDMEPEFFSSLVTQRYGGGGACGPSPPPQGGQAEWVPRGFPLFSIQSVERKFWNPKVHPTRSPCGSPRALAWGPPQGGGWSFSLNSLLSPGPE